MSDKYRKTKIQFEEVFRRGANAPAIIKTMEMATK